MENTGRTPGDSGHQTSTVLNKRALRNGYEPTIAIAVDTHRFQTIQLGSEWVEKVDQINQPKTVDSQ